MSENIKSKILIRLLMCGIFPLFICAICGCLALAGAAAGAAGVAYVQGALRGTVNANPPQYVDAAESVLKELNIAVQSKTADATSGNIKGETSDGRSVDITATRQGEGISNVAIRVGTFGDENLSRDIYDKIEARL